MLIIFIDKANLYFSVLIDLTEFYQKIYFFATFKLTQNYSQQKKKEINK